MKKLLVIALFFTSCSSYKQAEVKSTNTALTDKGYRYDNDTLSITYNFWANGGCMSFEVYNKLSIPIYIDWKNSALILNDNKKAYWMDREKSSAHSAYSGIAYRGIASGSVDNSGVSIHDERITSIPPRAKIRKVYAPITSNKKAANVDNADVSSSPYRFRNYLIISTDEQFKSTETIDNEFYTSKIFKTKPALDRAKQKTVTGYYIDDGEPIKVIN